MFSGGNKNFIHNKQERYINVQISLLLASSYIQYEMKIQCMFLVGKHENFLLT